MFDLFRRFSSNSAFLFDQKHCLSLSGEEKIKYLVENIDNFNDKFYLSSKIVKDKTGDIVRFAEIVANNYKQLLDEYIDNIFQFIHSVFNTLGFVPFSHLYAESITIFIRDIAKQKPNELNCISAFYKLLKNPDFCSEAVRGTNFSDNITSFLRDNQIHCLVSFLKLVSVSIVTTYIADVLPENYILQPFKAIIDLYNSKTEIFDNEEMVYFVFEYFMKLSVETKNEIFIESLDTYQIYESINNFILESSAQDFEKIYGPFLGYNSNSRVLKIVYIQYNIIYRDNRCTFETQRSILRFIVQKSNKFKNEYAFLQLADWCTQNVFTDEILFSTFSEFLLELAPENHDLIVPCLNHIIGQLVPYQNENHLTEKIIDLLLIILNKYGKTSFSPEPFLDNVILKAKNNNLLAWFSDSKFQSIYRIVIAKKYTGEIKDKAIMKTLDVIKSDAKLMIFFKEIVCENLDSHLFRFFLTNLHDKLISNLMYETVICKSVDIVDLFVEGNCISIIPLLIENSNFIVPFLTLVNTIVIQSNNHFFDEWVVNQSVDSPIFNIDKNDIYRLILPARQTDPIFIPSLVPLLQEFKTDSSVNYYLLGRYAIPVYLKLGTPLTNIPYFKQIINQYMRPSDIESIIRKDPKLVSEMIENGCGEGSNVYEFFPHHGVAYLQIEKQSCNYFSFSFKLLGYCYEPYPLVKINENTIYITEKYIFTSSNAKEVPIKQGEKITFSALYNKANINITLIYQDKTEVKIPPISSNKQMMIETIGSCDFPAPHILIYQDIFCSMTQSKPFRTQSNMEIKHHGSCCLILGRSLVSFYSDEDKLTHLFDMFPVFIESGLSKEFLALISRLSELFTINHEKLFYNMRYIMKEHSENVDTEWITILMKLLFQSPKDIRASILYTMFKDFEFWSVIDKTHINRFLAELEKIDSVAMYQALNESDAKEFIHLLYYISTLQDSDMLTSKMIKIFDKILKAIGEPLFETIRTLFSNTNTWAYNTPIDNIGPYFGNFTTVNKCHSAFLAVISKYEVSHNVEILPLRYIYYNSIISTNETSVTLLESLVERDHQYGFLSSNIPMLCIAFLKHCMVPSIWNMLLSKLTESKFNIESPTNVVPKNKFFIPPILSLLNQLLVKGSSDILEKVRASMYIIFCGQLPFIVRNSLSPFIKFITIKEEQLIIKETPYRTIKNNKLKKVIDVQAQLTDSKVIREWCTNAKKIVNHCSIESFTENHAHFIADLLVHITSSYENQMSLSKEPKALHAIAQHSNNITLKQFYIKYIPFLDFTNTKFLNIIAECLLMSYLIKPTIFEDGQIMGVLYDFCRKDQSLISIFLSVFIVNIQAFPNDEIISVIKVRVDSLDSCNIVALLQALVNDKIPIELGSVVINKSKKVFGSNDQLSRYIKDGKVSHLILNEKLANMKKIDSIELPKDEISGLYSILYEMSVHSAVDTLFLLRRFYQKFNLYLKNEESRYCKTYTRISKVFRAESYRSSPFIFPCTVPLYVIPSPFPVFTPSSSPPNVVKPITVLYNIKANLDTLLSIPSYLPKKLFRFSGLYHADGADVLAYFINIFGDYISAFNCTLIRVDTRIQATVFTYSKKTIILAGTQIKNELLILLEIPCAQLETFMESVLLDEYGEYSLYCGRAAIILKHEYIIHVRQTMTYCRPAVEIFSVQAGNFTLITQSSLSSLLSSSQLLIEPLEKFTELWAERKISNYHYLNVVNYYSKRSLTDLSSYPIFPRILMTIETDKFTQCGYRNLSLPIQIVSDPDPSHKQLTANFNRQKYFYSENVSNPTYVSLLHCRLLPFSRYGWTVNDGWDAGNRNFLNVSDYLSVADQTSYELTPEMYSLPDIFMNINNYSLSDGTNLDVTLPKWCNHSWEFVEKHRDALESEAVSNTLPNWLNLIFGVSQRSENEYNIYNPMSYTDNVPSEYVQKHSQWVETCGHVPSKIFTSKHKAKASRSSGVGNNESKHNINTGFIVILNPSYFDSIHISKVKRTVKDGNVQLKGEYLSTVIHASRTDDKYFTAITCESHIYIFYNNNDYLKLSSLNVNNPRQTIVFSNQLLALTITTNSFVIWCIANGRVINDIPSNDPSAVCFDKIHNSCFVAERNHIKQYTLSGICVREFESHGRVTAMCVAGEGFSIYERLIMLGYVNGLITYYALDPDIDKYVLLRTIDSITTFPIYKIKYIQDSNTLLVFDDNTFTKIHV